MTDIKSNLNLTPLQKQEAQTIVIKLGGSVEYLPEVRNELCRQITLLSQSHHLKLVIVHGGGKEINFWLNKLQKESFFKDGLRVTDNETMELVEMVLAGKVNGEIVQNLKKAGCKAIGLSGRSAGILDADVISSVNYGFVGNVTNANSNVIKTLLSEAYVPVIAPIGSGSEFGALNINADTAAAGIAGSLKADSFIFLTDVDGLYSNYGTSEQELICALQAGEVTAKLENGHIAGGMIPKLKSCLTALENGASKVIICNGAKENVLIDWIQYGVGCGTEILA